MTSTLQMLKARVAAEGGTKQAAIIEISNAPANIRPLLTSLGFIRRNDMPDADVLERRFVAQADMVALVAEMDRVRAAIAPYYGGDPRLSRSEYTGPSAAENEYMDACIAAIDGPTGRRF